MTFDEIAAIEKKCFLSPWTTEMIREELESPLSVFAFYEENAKVVSFALGRVVADEGEVFRIATLPEYQRRGLGARILSELLWKMREKGVAVCFLEVRSRNAPAIALYRKAGFESAYVRKNYYPDDDAIVMRKELQ